MEQGSVSNPQLISCGAPQGSYLGSLKLLIYINDLHGCLLHTKALWPHFANFARFFCAFALKGEVC